MVFLVNPLTVITIIWQFGLITNRGIDQQLLQTFIMCPAVQCAYPEKYMPLRIRQQGYLRPLHTIARLLCNTHKTNF